MSKLDTINVNEIDIDNNNEITNYISSFEGAQYGVEKNLWLGKISEASGLDMDIIKNFVEEGNLNSTSIEKAKREKKLEAEEIAKEEDEIKRKYQKYYNVSDSELEETDIEYMKTLIEDAERAENKKENQGSDPDYIEKELDEINKKIEAGLENAVKEEKFKKLLEKYYEENKDDADRYDIKEAMKELTGLEDGVIEYLIEKFGKQPRSKAAVENKNEPKIISQEEEKKRREENEKKENYFKGLITDLKKYALSGNLEDYKLAVKLFDDLPANEREGLRRRLSPELKNKLNELDAQFYGEINKLEEPGSGFGRRPEKPKIASFSFEERQALRDQQGGLAKKGTDNNRRGYEEEENAWIPEIGKKVFIIKEDGNISGGWIVGGVNEKEARVYKIHNYNNEKNSITKKIISLDELRKINEKIKSSKPEVKIEKTKPIKQPEVRIEKPEPVKEDIKQAEAPVEKLGFFAKAGNIFKKGFEAIAANPKAQKQLGKTAIGTITSIAGLKSFYDVPAYFRQRFMVRGNVLGIGQGKGLEGSIEALLEEAKIYREGEDKKKNGVWQSIKDLDKRLAMTREGSEKHSEQRKLIAKLLLENRHKEQISAKERHEEITKILDNYTTTKVTGMQAIKETLNTACVAAVAPTHGASFKLRALMYAGLSIAEKNQELKKEARIKAAKDNLSAEEIKKAEEKINLLTVFKEGFKETCQGISFQGEGDKLQKTLKAIKAGGNILRFLGIAATAFLSAGGYDEVIHKITKALEDKETYTKAGANFLQGSMDTLTLSATSGVIPEEYLSHPGSPDILPAEMNSETAPYQATNRIDFTGQPVSVTPIAEQIPQASFQGGKSVWEEAEKQLAVRFGEKFSSLDENLKNYNIDKIKDAIIAHPENFGLPAGADFNKLSAADLEKIDWNSVVNETLENKDGLALELPAQHSEEISLNNLREKEVVPFGGKNHSIIIDGQKFNPDSPDYVEKLHNHFEAKLKNFVDTPEGREKLQFLSEQGKKWFRDDISQAEKDMIIEKLAPFRKMLEEEYDCHTRINSDGEVTLISDSIGTLKFSAAALSDEAEKNFSFDNSAIWEGKGNEIDITKNIWFNDGSADDYSENTEETNYPIEHETVKNGPGYIEVADADGKVIENSLDKNLPSAEEGTSGIDYTYQDENKISAPDKISQTIDSSEKIVLPKDSAVLSLDAQTAKAFVEKGGDLYFLRLKGYMNNVEVAEALSKQKGYLDLRHVSKASPEFLQALRNKQGLTNLFGLKAENIDEKTAEILNNFKGKVFLNNEAHNKMEEFLEAERWVGKMAGTE